ncbi:MAG: metallophosphoesterase family protein [Chloroflexota bacterium]
MGNHHQLRFRADETFTVVQFTDIHWTTGGDADLKSRTLMQSIIEAEQPDLIILTGDLISAAACDDPLRAVRDVVSVVEGSRVPWAVVLGNHDSEANVSREALMDALIEHECCVAGRSASGVTGVGNYYLAVLDAHRAPAAVLYFLDAGNESPLAQVGGYDWIRLDQIQWYVAQSRAITTRNDDRSVPALAFFHIPLPEYRDVWNESVCYGHKFEDVCCPRLNSGLFTAMVEMGDVVGTFVGHDHVNDYWGMHHGIRLCYGRATGYNTYGREGFPRGARIIQLRRGTRRFTSWLRLDAGSVVREQPAHQPTGQNAIVS